MMKIMSQKSSHFYAQTLYLRQLSLNVCIAVQYRELELRTRVLRRTAISRSILRKFVHSTTLCSFVRLARLFPAHCAQMQRVNQNLILSSTITSI